MHTPRGNAGRTGVPGVTCEAGRHTAVSSHWRYPVPAPTDFMMLLQNNLPPEFTAPSWLLADGKQSVNFV